MSELLLFVAPGTCARVPTVALEEAGAKYETRLVRTSAHEQKTPEYLKINPKGKVPVLVVDGTPLTENVAILSWLNKRFPEAGLLPKAKDDFETAQQVSDLAFFSGTVHPVVTRVAMPQKFIKDEALAYDVVRAGGTKDMQPVMGMINDRLADRTWWYGDTWSIVDAYLFWTWWRIEVVGFDGSPFPHIKAHAERILERPSVKRAMDFEARNVEILRAEGNYREHR